MDPNTLYIGLDPGVEGAIALLTSDRKIVIVDMPILEVKYNGRKHTYVDPLELKRRLTQLVGKARELGLQPVALLEDVHATPQKFVGGKPIGKGPVAQFSLGNSKGHLEMALAFLEVPYYRVSPETWKKAFNLLGRDKEASVKLAKELFPEAAEDLRYKTKDGRAEALLLAGYQAGLRPPNAPVTPSIVSP